jgi:hypothetical protein
MQLPNVYAGTLLLTTVGCGLIGCASWTNPTVLAADVPPAQYLGLSCGELKKEKLRIGTRQADLAPTLLPMEDEQKREQELSQMSGELKAIAKVSADNKCS